MQMWCSRPWNQLVKGKKPSKRSTMAPPRADNKKFSKERSKQKAAKKPSKSSLPSTAVAVALTALVAICVAMYYKNGSGIETNLRQATKERTKEPIGTSNSKRSDSNADFKVLPRLNGVKVRNRDPVIPQKLSFSSRAHRISDVSLYLIQF